MTDIELVIKIPKEVYEEYKGKTLDRWNHSQLAIYIANGKPLPKGHGRLIDADVLADGFEDNYEFCEVVNATPTIIEADKESEVSE